MQLVILALATLGTPITAGADWFTSFVRIECNQSEGFLGIYYEGGYNEEGERLLKEAGPEAINPWDLVEYDDDLVASKRSVKRTCILDGHSYTVEVKPVPGASNAQAQCGQHMTATFEVLEDGEFLGFGDFGDKCQSDLDAKITTRVLWRAGSKSPKITEIPRAEFYH